MNYLIDTNIFIFLIDGLHSRFSIAQSRILSDTKNEIFVSESSLFEIGIKIRLQKSTFSHLEISTIDAERKRLNINLLKPKIAHYLYIPEVPKVYMSPSKLHADPFDLLIISQALIEKLPILSTDRYFPEYEGLQVIG